MKTSAQPIYVDNHATTPLDPRVLNAMMPYLTNEFGNPSSRTHCYGNKAREAVEKARRQVAELIHAHPSDIIFTSGATESNNMAIFGALHGCRDAQKHIVTTAIEHHAVIDCCAALKKENVSTTYVTPQSDGVITSEPIANAITPATRLVSVMAVNNEIVTVNDIEKIAQITKNAGVIFHCDAVQAVGRVDLNVEKNPIDLLSLSSHKIYGPKGVGALYLHQSLRERFVPCIYGGGQECNLRSGTLNVPGIVGLGEACELMRLEHDDDNQRILAMREYLRNKLEAAIEGLKINGSLEKRVCGNLSVVFPHITSEELLLQLANDVAASASSACTSSQTSPSHVLRAIGLLPEQIASTVRFGIGRFNTPEQIEQVADYVVACALKKSRKILLMASLASSNR